MAVGARRRGGKEEAAGGLSRVAWAAAVVLVVCVALVWGLAGDDGEPEPDDAEARAAEWARDNALHAVPPPPADDGTANLPMPGGPLSPAEPAPERGPAAGDAERFEAVRAGEDVAGMSGALGYPATVNAADATAAGLEFPLPDARWERLVAFLNRNVSTLHEMLPPCGWAPTAGAPPPELPVERDSSLPRARLVLWALAELDAKWFQGAGLLYTLSGRTLLGAVRAGGLVAHAPWADIEVLTGHERLRRMFRRLRGVVDDDDPFRLMRSAAGRVRVRQDGPGGARLAVEFVPDAEAFVREHPRAAAHAGYGPGEAGGSLAAATGAVRQYLGPDGWTCDAHGACGVLLVRVRLASEAGPALAVTADRLCRCPFAPLRTGLVCRQDAPERGMADFGV